MDFFEKAHVVKKTSTGSDHKAVKKQLKQMLHGYKQHDNNLIRNCEDTFDPTRLLDESSSVSGFSDLNLTNSSNDADITQNTLEIDSEVEDDTADIEESSGSDVTGSNKAEPTDKNVEISMESISEYDDTIETLSDNISTQVTLDSCSETSHDITFSDCMEESDSVQVSDDSEFDADGELASKIIKCLKKKGVVKPERGKKRKLESKIDSSCPADKQIKDRSNRQKKEPTQNNNLYTHEVDESNMEDTTDAISSINDSNSSDFISIQASDMPVQSLSEIIGEYRYPTVRNLPDSQNLGSNTPGAFCIEDMSVEDLHDHESMNDAVIQIVANDEESVENNEDLNTSNLPVSESSMFDSYVINEQSACDNDLTENVVDVNFVNPVKMYDAKSHCIFVLKHPAELYIGGKVIVRALGRTSMELFGYTLQDKALEIFASSHQFAHCIKTIGKKSVNKGMLHKELISIGLSVDEAKELVSDLNECDGVVSMKRLHSYKIDFIENNITPSNLLSKTSKNTDACFNDAAVKLGCSLNVIKPNSVFEEPRNINEIIRCGSVDQSRGIICGGKGVGKSTLVRYCVNRLVSQGPVLVIDLDPGQAEFTVAGNVSATIVDEPLLGPNFTHLKTPKIMLNLGMINTMDNPRRYATAVKTLIRQCNNDKQLKVMPWIINTMGMVNAIGLKFIVLAILETQPTYLVQINTRNPKKSFGFFLNPQVVQNLYEEYKSNDCLFRDVNNPDNLDYSYFLNENNLSPNNKSSIAPRDERYLNFLAYFGQMINSRIENGLLGIIPYEVNLGDVKICLNIKIRDDAVTKVINGKIIALCQLAMSDNEAKVFTMKDKPLVCHGHGLIRGIDLEKQLLYMITPTPGEKLMLVNTIVYSDWMPELRGQEKHLPDGVTVPYRTTSMYQKRQLLLPPQRRFNPLQLLKMSRST